MQRVTLALTDETAAMFERIIRERGYSNRSEAFRDILRQIDAEERLAEGDGPCAAVVSYVFNHHERQLAARMTEHQHAHGDVVHSVMHVHLNHEDCLEAIVLCGSAQKVMTVANAIIAEPAVKHGCINAVPLLDECSSRTPAPAAHDHDHDHNHDHQHDHRR